ncbi:MAG: helix-turn-helix domain-containing protein [Nanoarchaeota archaeon]|nr:helix-turn-helix domain-containing protein [Nanoarchaeota archaeon]
MLNLMQELQRLIENGESETVEFKESLSLKNEIGETVSAFSNTNKGTIIIGISDSGRIIGVEVGKKTLEGLANYIKQNTDNHIYPKMELVESINNKNLILIEVNEANEKPIFFRGNAYRRISKSNHKLSASEIRKLAKESGEKNYWDEQICEGACLEDIDEERVKWFLEKAKTERNFDVDPGTPLKEALERLSLIKNGKLTNASILLFAKNPQKFFLQARIRCARFKGVDTLNYLDMKVIDGTVTEIRQDALKFIMQHTKHAVYFDANRRYDQWEYPLRALEEVLTNALAHREYNTSEEIQLSIYDDSIEVWNPGGLPNQLTFDDLKKKHKSIPKNPLIAEMLFLIRYIEKWGKGTNRILNEMKKQKLSEPEFQGMSHGFEVVLTGPGDEFKERIERETLSVLEINERQKKAIEYIKENQNISRQYYMKINDVSHTTAHKELKDMVKKRILIEKGAGKYRRYRLTQG